MYNHLKDFLYQRLHLKDIALKELTLAFIKDFDMYLRTDRHCCNNTVWIYTAPLRTMVNVAIDNGWPTRDPFRKYEIEKEETARTFLNKDEIARLLDTLMKNVKQELIRDLFLGTYIQVYTKDLEIEKSPCRNLFTTRGLLCFYCINSTR
ncbi:integrase domain protein [Bacteroides fragilis str. 3986 N(B)19]|nr:integrase domain protein [Bacteroides fragilis str. 3986 N(B)19]